MTVGTGDIRQWRVSKSALPGVFLCVVLLVGSACGSRGAAGQGASSPEIAEVSGCPSPPAVFGTSATIAWLDRCVAVGRAAAGEIDAAIARADDRRHAAWQACVGGERDAIVGLTRRMSAERMMLSGYRGERAALRVRLHCQRIQRSLIRARACERSLAR